MSEHPFKKLSQAYHDRAATHAQVQYEESRVSFLLKRFKLSKMERDLRKKWERETGQYRLTFKGFNDEFPSFPILLGSSTLGGVKLHLDPRAMLPALFKRFADVPFVHAYEEFFETAGPQALERSVGLVFPRKGFPQGLIICNSRLESVPYSGLTLHYTAKPKRGEEPFQLYVRPFQALVDAIHNEGHGWRPE